MIVNGNNGGEVIASQGIQSKELRIKASGKAFRAMLDGIYKDKPGSIVRELYTNGLDGQRVRGNVDRPLTVHLPNIYEPHFSIRDYGCSMSPTQIEDIYGVLFESSKDQSNDQAGGFGLGGKNFLSYQDSGTIICYLDGIKYDYVLMYGPDGTPRIYPMGTSETEEENGVYVEIAIKDGDYRLFHSAVESQLRWLNVMPVLNNNSSNTVIHSPTFAHTYGKFKTFDNNPHNPRGFWIVQGEIGYWLDINTLEQYMKNKTALEFFKAYNGGALYFDIGEISVTLGREDIQYDDQTIASIEKFVSDVAPIITKDIIDEVDKLPNAWEKMRYLNTDSSLFRIAGLAGIELDGGKAKIYKGNNKWQLDVSFLVNKDSKLAFCQYKSSKRDYFSGNGIVIHPEARLKIYIRDIGRGAISRMKYNEVTSTATKIFMLEHRDGYEHIDQALIDDLQERFAGIEIIRVSTLAEPPKIAGARNGSPLVYQWTEYDEFDKITKWDRIYDEEEIENGYYVIFERYPHLDIKSDTIKVINEAFESGHLDKTSIKIYAIKQSRSDLFTTNANFVNLETKANEIMAEVRAKYDGREFIKRYVLAKKVVEETKKIIDNCKFNSMVDTDLAVFMSNKKSFLRRIMKMNKLATRYVERIDATVFRKLRGLDIMLVRSNSAAAYNNVTIPDLQIPSSDDILNRYPMLKWISRPYYYGKDAALSNEMVKYIGLIDRQLTQELK